MDEEDFNDETKLIHRNRINRKNENWKRRSYLIIGMLALISTGLVIAIIVLTLSGAPISVNKCHVRPNNYSVQDIYQNAAVSSDAVPCASISSNLMSIKRASAVDASIAGIICSCVVNLHSCGIGGGSFINIYLKSTKKVHTIDLREVAGENATENMFVNEQDPNNNSEYGPRSIGVFGMISGLHEIYLKLGGSITWKDILAPTIDLTENGFLVSSNLNEAIDKYLKKPQAQHFVELKKALTDPNTNKGYKQGDRLKLPKLANTLRILTDDPYAIRNGSLTDKVLNEIGVGAGGIIQKSDLNKYRPIWRESVKISLFTGHKLYTLPPPSSGALVAFTLNVMNQYDWSQTDLNDCSKAGLFYHRFVETMKFAYAKRSALGDESFVDVKQILKNLTSLEYADYIKSRITDNKTHPVSYYGPEFQNPSDHGTSHFSLIAPNGDAVSATSTINTHFGSKVMGPETGIIYNNEMDDFSTPNKSNYFNLPPSPSNFIKPFKRPMSSMSPVIIVDKNDRAVFIAGASGGSLIISSTAQTAVSAILLNKTVKEAIDLPRTHHQLLPDVVVAEMNLPQGVVEELETRGHVVVKKTNYAVVEAILREEKNINKIYQCNADFRKRGLCGGF